MMNVNTPASIAHASSESSIVVSTPLYETSQDLDSVLYPKAEAFDEGMLKVSDLHTLWYAQYGNPKGAPVLVVHGGPGAGCDPALARYTDPDYYRIILVNQRGASQSIPHAEMRENNTANLIEDFEKVRKHLGIEKWILFGGSWGSTLSLAYGEEYPDVILGFVLRGIFLASRENIHQIWYGMGEVYPEAWDEFISALPENERPDLINAFYKRVMDPSPDIHMPVARALIKYSFIGAALLENSGLIELLKDDKLVLSVARSWSYYAENNFFLTKNQLLDNVSRISHLPCIIVQGRHDINALPQSAYKLHKSWPGSKLVFVPDAAHTAFDPGLSKAIRDAADEMRVKHL
jgi:proline iminopeptidase